MQKNKKSCKIIVCSVAAVYCRGTQTLFRVTCMSDQSGLAAAAQSSIQPEKSVKTLKKSINVQLIVQLGELTHLKWT